MARLEAVHGHAGALEPGLLRRAGALGREPAAARRRRALHAARAHVADDVEPVLAEVGLAADERDLFDPEVGHLIDEVEAFGRRELVGARLAGA